MRPAYYACIFLETTGTHSYLLGSATSDELRSATEILEQVESSLDDKTASCSCDSNCSEEDEEKIMANVEIQTKFTSLVKKLNDSVSADTLRVLRHYLDTHPEKFHPFPSVMGNKMYPSPYAIAEEMKKHGCDPLTFLTDISHPQHVPPHILVCELLSQKKHLQKQVESLQRKLDQI